MTIYVFLMGSGIKLREIRDNLYIFAADSCNFGMILASRTNGEDPDGDDLFHFLKINKDEQKELHGLLTWCKEAVFSIVTSYKYDKPRAVAIFPLFRCPMPICLAIELFGDIEEAKAAFDRHILEWYEPPRTRTRCESTYADGILDMCVRLLSDMKTDSEGAYADRMHALALDAAYLVGTELNTAISRYEADNNTSDAIFSHSGYLTVLLCMLCAARRAAPDRRLCIYVDQASGSGEVVMSFVSNGETEISFDKYLGASMAHAEIPISFECGCGNNVCSVVPFQNDIALLQLKNPDRYIMHI